MDITISPTSGAPIYQQIYDQISAQILNGALIGDSALPSIRTVAKELRISVITVKKAWELLEQAGFIYTQTGRGCFVAPHPPQARAAKREALALSRLPGDIAYYKQLGLSMDQLIALIRAHYDD